MTADSIIDTLRQAEAASKAARMSKQQKIALLKSAGWQNTDNNRCDPAMAAPISRSPAPFKRRSSRIWTGLRDSNRPTQPRPAAVGRQRACGQGVPIPVITSYGQARAIAAIAAQRCTGCVVLDPCAAVAVEEDHRWGVWGSRDFSRRPGVKKQAAA